MITAFTGKTGSGKTKLMIDQAYAAWRDGVNIYSNTILFFDKYAQHTLFQRVRGLLRPKTRTEFGKIVYFQEISEILHVHDGIILFDEAQVLFNARNWESLPDDFQYKLQQHRKHRLSLFVTTQNLRTIDITYRRLIHQWVHCERIFSLGNDPRLVISLHRLNYKDVDQIYSDVDDLKVDTLSRSWFFIHYFTRRLYDTMYDIGFKRFRTLWLSTFDQNLKIKETWMILPKKMSLRDGLKEVSLLNSALNPKRSMTLRKT